MPNTYGMTNARWLTKIDSKTGPSTGDGWFYRIVDEGLATTGATPTAYLVWLASLKEPQRRFPVSSCRKITLQIIWWRALSDRLNNKPAHDLEYRFTIADPNFIDTVQLPYAGSINFRTSCGAYAVATFAPATGSDAFTAATGAVSSTLKAQSDWETAKKKAKG